jgi:hypothetical protein
LLKLRVGGVRIFGKLVEIEGLPAVEFILLNADTSKKLVSVSVDGWSGRIAVDGVWGDRSYVEPQNLRECIYSALTDHLDKITATVA